MSNEININSNSLFILQKPNTLHSINKILDNLREDKVILIKGLSPNEADTLIESVAEFLQLSDSLKIQAGFASIQGHRKNIGKYFMSVNKRNAYDFITPHSEGDSLSKMQLASFYCYKNTTNGGESILFNVNSDSTAWRKLREETIRLNLNDYKPSPSETLQARLKYQIDLENDIIKKNDKILEKIMSPIDGIEAYKVLTSTRKAYCSILKKEVYPYWDSVASTDHASPREFFSYLSNLNILHGSSSHKSITDFDNVRDRRVYDSQVKFTELFKNCLITKLIPGDFILMNNLTWAHSSNNWSPDSGERQVAASFA